MKARTQAGYDMLVKHPLVDASQDRAGRLLLRRHDRRRVRSSTGVPLDAMVSIHGSFNGPSGRVGARTSRAQVLILHGAEDVPAIRSGGGRGDRRAARSQGASSSTSSTAAPATASRRRRTRPTSAPTRSRSLRPNGSSKKRSRTEPGSCHDMHRIAAALRRRRVRTVCAGAAQAEIKTEWVEYSHGDVKLKGYLAYDDAITGKRPAVLVIHAREGMTANTKKNVEMFAQVRLRRLRRRHLRLRPGRAAEGRAGNAGADRDVQQGPRRC